MTNTPDRARPSLAELVARARNSSATDPTWRTDYRISAPTVFCPFAVEECTSGCPSNRERACVDGP